MNMKFSRLGPCCLLLLFWTQVATAQVNSQQPELKYVMKIDFSLYPIFQSNLSLPDRRQLRVYHQVSTAKTDPDGYEYADISLNFGSALGPKYPTFSSWIQYNGIRHGTILPAFGRIYEVTHITVSKEYHHMVRIAVLAPENIPTGVTAGYPTHLATLGGIVSWGPEIKTDSCSLEFIASTPMKDKEEPVLSLRTRYTTDFKSATDKKTTVHDLKAKLGDTILVGDRGHKIVNVVPPSAKTKVIGWVELDPNGLTEKEMTEKKITPIKGNLVSPQERK